MNNYWFFLSYAKRDAKENPWLKRFYKALTLEIGRIVGLPATIKEKEIGFLDDEGIEVGDEWPKTLAEALQTSRVFICLYSAGYFNSEFCGKEFQVFQSRINDYISTTPQATASPPLIIPVLWERPSRLPKPLPSAVMDIQYTDTDFGELYAQEGLLYIMKMGEKAEYRRFIMNFAERIVREARSHQLPRLQNILPLQTIVSAFRPLIPLEVSPVATLLENVAVPEFKGPETAWFVYVVGRAVDLQNIRDAVDYYGLLGGREWRPYLPISDAKVGLLVQSVATSKRLLNETLPISEQFINHLREAEATNTIVIIVVDPWSIQVESYQSPMDSYDKNRLENCGVLVVWNDNDNETVQHREVLESTVERIFYRHISSKDSYFRGSVRSEEMLISELNSAIDELQGRIIKRARLLRSVKSSGKTLPRINVSTGETL